MHVRFYSVALAQLALPLVLLCAAPPALAQERSIDKEVIIKASLEQAWQSWTTREGIVAFFAPDARIDARVGGAFQIYMDPGAAPGSKGADDMRVMALQPLKMISFDWNAPPACRRRGRSAPSSSCVSSRRARD